MAAKRRFRNVYVWGTSPRHLAELSGVSTHRDRETWEILNGRQLATARRERRPLTWRLEYRHPDGRIEILETGAYTPPED